MSWLPILMLIVAFEIICLQPALAGLSVEYLPGFEGQLPFQLETGYIGVGEAEVQVFYYFIKSESNPKVDPLIYWFTGGPGCSGLSAIFFEFGPITLDTRAYNGSLPTLSLNPYAYTKVASIIFVDLPVGTGFSYATTQKANYSDNLLSADHGYEFIRKWLIEHQEYLNNTFYVGGDSYSGITVPIVTQFISNGNDMGIKPWINLKGYILGNPVTFAGQDYYIIPFAHGMGLISGELYEKEWHTLALIWANDNNVRDALHVRKKTIGAWEECRGNLSFGDIINNTIPYHSNLSRKGFRSLIYSGDHDMVIPFISTQVWIKSLNYSIIDDWRPWIVDGQVAGYTRSYSNKMTFVTVKGAGHTTPEYKPVQSLAMLKRWLSYESL